MSKTQMAVDYLADRAEFRAFARLLFLADWKNCLSHGRQITDLGWSRRCGKIISDVPLPSRRTNLQHLFGRPKSAYAGLSSEDRDSLDHVLRETQSLNPSQICRLVDSTHPFLSGAEDEILDLPALAAEYLALRPAA